MKKMTNAIFQWPIIIVACLTIGLAPYTPEPHIWGKVKWVLGGGEGMQLIDLLDLLMHSAPWVLLLIKTISSVFSKRS